jgi:hypothetical protein
MFLVRAVMSLAIGSVVLGVYAADLSDGPGEQLPEGAELVEYCFEQGETENSKDFPKTCKFYKEQKDKLQKKQEEKSKDVKQPKDEKEAAKMQEKENKEDEKNKKMFKKVAEKAKKIAGGKKPEELTDDMCLKILKEVKSAMDGSGNSTCCVLIIALIVIALVVAGVVAFLMFKKSGDTAEASSSETY